MINPIGPSIRDAFAVVVMPDFSISTSEAYKLVNYARIGRDRGKTYKLMCSTLGEGFRGIVENMHNDFETFMLDAKPELLKIKQAMLESGAENAIMSGSGSSLFSLAENRKQAEGIKSSIDEKKLGKAFLCRTVN